ncbi:MAG: hypothetical protein CR991_04800 [Proteobacteria bacterium]|nr:MAG: hypothetical protein CR991_04800 [Pseudomonadota bacterium]
MPNDTQDSLNSPSLDKTTLTKYLIASLVIGFFALFATSTPLLAQTTQQDLQKIRADMEARREAEISKLRAEMALKQQTAMNRLRTKMEASTTEQSRSSKALTQLPLPNGELVNIDNTDFERQVHNYLATKQFDKSAIFDKLYFESGSDQLNAASQEQVKVIAALLHHYTDKHILLQGHTDNTGNLEENTLLSLRRSNTVKKALTQLGIDPKRIQIEGMGSLKPIASNDTKEGREQNRRLELMITK